MNKEIKKLQKSASSLIGYKLLLILVAIIFFFLWNVLTGKVNIENFIHERNRGLNLNLNHQYLLERIIEAKDYLIPLGFLAIAVYFLRRSNMEWEEKYLQQNGGEKLNKEGELSVVEEDKEEEDKIE